MSEKLYLSWEDIHQLTSKIHNETLSSDKENLAIIGISRGGLVPAVLMSHMKNPSLFCTVGIKSYEGEKRKQDQIYQLPPAELLQNKDVIYLIDDICDTGKTLLNLKQNMLHLNVISISLVYKRNELHKPDYYGFEHSDDRWVVFPWENHK
jgi:hypoxanthine phosphoribosyltransferase